MSCFYVNAEDIEKASSYLSPKWQQPESREFAFDECQIANALIEAVFGCKSLTMPIFGSTLIIGFTRLWSLQKTLKAIQD
jgi:hypothetical protein